MGCTSVIRVIVRESGCDIGCNMWVTTAGLQHLVAVSCGSVRGCHYEVFTIEGVTPVDVNVHL